MNFEMRQGDEQYPTPGVLAAALTLLGFLLVILVIATAVATWQTITGGFFATSSGGWMVVGMFAFIDLLISGWMYQLRLELRDAAIDRKKPRQQRS